jgi:hypothetical protein
MDDIPPNEKKPLTRKEAATYLTARWFRMTPGSLAQYASKGLGPAYVNRGAAAGGEALYQRSDLDAWAERIAMVPK